MPRTSGSVGASGGQPPGATRLRHTYPHAKDVPDRDYLIRAEIGYDYSWGIDVPYWEHCQKRFSEKYPAAMAKVAEGVERHLQNAA